VTSTFTVQTVSADSCLALINLIVHWLVEYHWVVIADS